jgi:hypothetical protein
LGVVVAAGVVVVVVLGAAVVAAVVVVVVLGGVLVAVDFGGVALGGVGVEDLQASTAPTRPRTRIIAVVIRTAFLITFSLLFCLLNLSDISSNCTRRGASSITSAPLPVCRSAVAVAPQGADIVTSVR